MKPADVAAIMNIPFVQIALPVIITCVIASWGKGKRFDNLNRRLDEVIKRLDKIDKTLSEFAQPIVRVQERTLPLAL